MPWGRQEVLGSAMPSVATSSLVHCDEHASSDEYPALHREATLIVNW